MPPETENPIRLSKEQRKSLLRALKTEPPDAKFNKFVEFFEWVLADYVIWRNRLNSKTLGADARKACDDIKKAAIRLRGAWNKAPLEAFKLLDAAHHMRTMINRIPTTDIKQTYTWHYTKEFSPDQNAFFAEFMQSTEEMIKTAEVAATPSHQQYKGGKPRNIHLRRLARAIADGLDHFLKIEPKTTPTGAFSEVLHQAVEFVGNGSEPSSLSRYVRQVVEENRRTSGQPDQELPKPSK